MAAESQEGREFFYGWVVALTCTLVLFASWGTIQGSGVFVNPLTEEMGWSRTAVSAAFSINLGVSFVLAIFWGWLSDRWGIRSTIAATGMLLGLGYYLSSMANAPWQLYLYFGVIAGAGFGGSAGPASAIISRWFQRRRGFAVSIGFAGIHAGTAAMPVVALSLISLNGWRSGFQYLSYLIWGAYFVAAILLRDPRPAGAKLSPQHLSSALASSTAARADPGDRAAHSLSSAVRTKAFWMLFAMLVPTHMLLAMVVVHIVPRATDTGISDSTAATLITVMACFSLVSTLASGALSDRFGPRRVFISALLLQMVALLWLVGTTQLWMFYIFAIAFGIGFGGWSPMPPAFTARLFGTQHMGAIIGVALLGGGAGALIGPIMAGAIFDATGSYRIAFLISAGFALMGAVLAYMLGRQPAARHRI